MVNNHFADVGKKDTMSLTLALIVLDRLNTTERIDVARDNLAEAVRVVSAAAKKQVLRRPITINNYCGHCFTAKKMPNVRICTYTRTYTLLRQLRSST